MYGWPRPFCVLLERTRPPRRAAPAEADLAADAGNGRVAGEVDRNGARVDARDRRGKAAGPGLAPLKPNLVSLMIGRAEHLAES